MALNSDTIIELKAIRELIQSSKRDNSMYIDNVKNTIEEKINKLSETLNNLEGRVSALEEKTEV